MRRPPARARAARSPAAGDSRSRPTTWARLGQRAEARRWLDRLREHRPSEDPARFWDELEIRLLRGEAEAVVLDDPVFPDDPFAR